ncbi:MAG: hypothetical protein ACK2U2_10690 [Anaerolineae bacterium]
MSRERVLRSSGLAAIASGVVLLLLALVMVADRVAPGIPDAVLSGLRLGANIIVVFALMGILYALSPWSGRLGQAGIVLAVIGLLLFMAGFFPVASWAVLLLGLLLFAIASTHAGLRIGPGAWLWLLGSGLAFAMALVDRPVLMALGMLISGCGQIWLGCSARCERPAMSKVSGPEAAVPAR